MKLVFTFILFVIIGTTSVAQTNTSSLLKYALKLTAGDENRRGLLTGTGFLLHYKNEYFLVTNFHVLTAKDPDTGLKLPDYRDTCHFVAVSFRDNHTGTTLTRRVLPLYDSAGTKRYSVYHYVQGAFLDIAVMRFERSDFLDLRDTIYAIRDFDLGTENLHGIPGVLVGFPKGKVIGGWKPSIAPVVSLGHSDYTNDVVNPFIFIQQGSEYGMSGAPLFFQIKKTRKYLLAGILFGGLENTSNRIIKGTAVNIREVIRLIDAMIKENKQNIDLFVEMQR